MYAQDFKDSRWIKNMKSLIAAAQGASVPLYIVSPNAPAGLAAFSAEGISANFFTTDFTIVRTVARTNPTILFLENGTIKNRCTCSHSLPRIHGVKHSQKIVDERWSGSRRIATKRAANDDFRRSCRKDLLSNRRSKTDLDFNIPRQARRIS